MDRYMEGSASVFASESPNPHETLSHAFQHLLGVGYLIVAP